MGFFKQAVRGVVSTSPLYSKIRKMEHIFFKDGDFQAMGGFYVRNNLKEFLNTLQAAGLNPVGLKVDDESFNLEVIVERNQAYIDKYENK
jgi:hypothetical protein